MHPLRKRKVKLILWLLLLVSVVISLVLYALRQNISLFYTPSEIVSGKVPLHQWIRAGGLVVNNSVVKSSVDLSMRFKLTDRSDTIEVAYVGILPDLFREGQGVVVQGELVDTHHFKATTVLAKHDEKYMPPEVQATLKPISGDAHVA